MLVRLRACLLACRINQSKMSEGVTTGVCERDRRRVATRVELRPNASHLPKARVAVLWDSALDNLASRIERMFQTNQVYSKYLDGYVKQVRSRSYSIF